MSSYGVSGPGNRFDPTLDPPAVLSIERRTIETASGGSVEGVSIVLDPAVPLPEGADLELSMRLFDADFGKVWSGSTIASGATEYLFGRNADQARYVVLRWKRSAAVVDPGTADRAPGTILPIRTFVSPTEAEIGALLQATVEGDLGQPEGSAIYQWERDGAPIAGATGANHLAVSAGSYTCTATISNAIGLAADESDPATVTAMPVVTDRAPGTSSPITSTVSPASGDTGQTFSVTVGGDLGLPTGTIAYQWKLDGSSISGATAPAYVSETPGALTCTVTVTNATGSASATSSAAPISVPEEYVEDRSDWPWPVWPDPVDPGEPDADGGPDYPSDDSNLIPNLDEDDTDMALLDSLIVPHLLFPSLARITKYPKLSSGISQTNEQSFNLDGSADWGRPFLHCYFEAAKNSYKSILLNGIFRTTLPFFLPMCSSNLSSAGRVQGRVYFDGPANTPFVLGGPIEPPEVAMYVTSATVTGGKLTVTIGVPNGGSVPAAKVRRATQAKAGADWITLLTMTDPWGAWLSEFAAAGLRGASSGYARMTVESFDEVNRTITFTTGMPAFTPKWICWPGLEADETFDALDSHPRHGNETIHDLTFHARGKGSLIVGYGHTEAVVDPVSRWERVKLAQFTDIDFAVGSDSIIEDLDISRPTGNITLKSVDSTWYNLKFSSTQKGGVLFDETFGNSGVGGRVKAYFMSQNAASEAEAWTFKLGFNLQYVDFTGQLVAEDTAGPLLYINHHVHNVHIHHLDGNAIGAMGLGSPGTIGWRPWWPSDAIRTGPNQSMTDVSVKGILRTVRSRRAGQHVRHAVYIDAQDTNNWGQTGGRYRWTNVRVDLTFVDADITTLPSNEIPDIRKPLWNNSKADYTVNTVIQLVDTADAIRYRCNKANPPAGVSPASNPLDGTTRYWVPVGGDRNAWLGAFKINGEVANAPRYREFDGCEIKINGRRHPDYHERVLLARAQFACDWEQDFIPVDQTGAAAVTKLDCFSGPNGKRQVWEAREPAKSAGAALTQNVVLEPGSSGAYTRTAGFVAGAKGTLRRVGSRMTTEHRDGKLHWLPTDQIEVIPNGTSALSLDISDFGKMLSFSSNCTISMPSAAALPQGWFVQCTLSAAATLTLSGTVSGDLTLTAQDGILLIEKRISALRAKKVL